MIHPRRQIPDCTRKSRSTIALVIFIAACGLVYADAQAVDPTAEYLALETQSLSYLERKLSAVLTPEQSEAYTAGMDPAEIDLENGETLEEFISRQERSQQAGLVYKPVAPCVLLDTRQIGDPFSTDEIRTLLLRGTATNYSEYGGSSPGCGIPGLRGDVFKRNTARAVFLSIEISEALGDGHFKTWPANEHPAPNVGVFQYTQFSNSASSVIVSLCDEESLEPCTDGDINLQTNGSGAHVTITALGYFKELSDHLSLTDAEEFDQDKSTESPFWEEGTVEGKIHYSDGNVGIGTPDPETKLEVIGTVQADKLNAFKEGGSWSSMASFESKNPQAPYINWYHSRSGGTTTRYGYIQVGEFSDGKKRFKFVAQNGANFLFSGRVGIGVTADDNHPLTLLGNYAAKPVAITQNQVGGDSTMELTTQDTAGNQATRLLFRGGGDIADIEFYRGGRGSEVASMFIKGTDGNVGIGTTTPWAKLEVMGQTNSRTLKLHVNNESTSYKDQIMISGSMDTGYGIAFGGQGHHRGGIYARNVGGTNNAEGEMTIWSRGGGNIILSGGNVGVGTTAPAEKLHVAGKLKVDGDIVSDGDICIGKCG